MLGCKNGIVLKRFYCIHNCAEKLSRSFVPSLTKSINLNINYP